MQRILVVDDDEAMREIIKDNLSSAYEVVETGEPENVLALTLEHRPDAILLDLSMPGISGFELCRALSSLSFTKQIPIFIVSGEDERNKSFCESLGAVGYFRKPINFSILKANLEKVVHPKIPERRANVRVPLNLTLKLKGRTRSNDYFEVRVATENVSKGGFICACSSSLDQATTVAVSLCGEYELDLGLAYLVRVATAEGIDPHYAFQFIGTKGGKILE